MLLLRLGGLSGNFMQAQRFELEVPETALEDLQARLARKRHAPAARAAPMASAAAALNINGTPGLVIGDTVIPGAIGIEELQTVIDKERTRQG